MSCQWSLWVFANRFSSLRQLKPHIYAQNKPDDHFHERSITLTGLMVSCNTRNHSKQEIIRRHGIKWKQRHAAELQLLLELCSVNYRCLGASFPAVKAGEQGCCASDRCLPYRQQRWPPIAAANYSHEKTAQILALYYKLDVWAEGSSCSLLLRGYCRNKCYQIGSFYLALCANGTALGSDETQLNQSFKFRRPVENTNTPCVSLLWWRH